MAQWSGALPKRLFLAAAAAPRLAPRAEVRGARLYTTSTQQHRDNIDCLRQSSHRSSQLPAASSQQLAAGTREGVTLVGSRPRPGVTQRAAALRRYRFSCCCCCCCCGNDLQKERRNAIPPSPRAITVARCSRSRSRSRRPLHYHSKTQHNAYVAQSARLLQQRDYSAVCLQRVLINLGIDFNAGQTRLYTFFMTSVSDGAPRRMKR